MVQCLRVGGVGGSSENELQQKKANRASRMSTYKHSSMWKKKLRGRKQILLMFEQIIAFTLHLSNAVWADGVIIMMS